MPPLPPSPSLLPLTALFPPPPPPLISISASEPVTTCEALQKIATIIIASADNESDVECTTIGGDNCMTLRCVEDGLTSQLVVLPCNDPPAIQIQ